MSWDDPRLSVASDPAMRAKYRRHQSWYREHVLDACYGTYGSGVKERPVGSLLAPREVQERPALNFLELDHVVTYVRQRVPEVKAEGGTLAEKRLRHNMLSSTPMAFTLTALMRSAGDPAAVVRGAFGVDCTTVQQMDAEWAPDPASHLNDRSAFDLVIRFETSGGRSAVLGVETKYTEPLSPKVYDTPRYRQVTDNSGWFVVGSVEALRPSATNQLWRNAMLAASMEMAGDVDIAYLGVIGLEEDTSLWKAVDVLGNQCRGADSVVATRWEALLSRLSGTGLAFDVARMRERYLPG